MRFSDGCRITDLIGDYNSGYDPQDVLLTEWIRHKVNHYIFFLFFFILDMVITF